MSTAEGELHKPKTKCILRSYSIELLNAKVSEKIVITNLIVIQAAMAFVRSVTSDKS